MTYEELVEWLIENGYMTKDFKPLRCYRCESTALEEYNEHYEHYGRCEYSVRCSHCKAHQATWAYGTWYL